MKSARILISAVTAAAIAGLAATPTVADQGIGAGGAAATPAVSTPATASMASTVAAGVAVIKTAPDPSTAIAAYASAEVSAPGNLDIERAYVRRMVDFGLPEMAETQAKDLVQREPLDGLAWAVTGYMSAKRGETAQAIEDLAQAAKELPGDAFVQRTAGQVLAWYDLQADEGKPGTPEHAAAEMLRGQLIGKTVYTAAYNAAVKADEATAEAPATQPATQPAGGVATSGAVGAAPGTTPDFQPSATAYTPGAAEAGIPLAAVPMDNTYNPYATYSPYTPTYYAPYDNAYGVYTNPYAVVGQPCAAWCPCPCVTGPVWWPVLPTVVIGGNGFGHPGRLLHHEPNRDNRGTAGARDHDGFAGPEHVWNGQRPPGAAYRPATTGVRGEVTGGLPAGVPVFAVPTAGAIRPNTTPLLAPLQIHVFQPNEAALHVMPARPAVEFGGIRPFDMGRTAPMTGPRIYMPHIEAGPTLHFAGPEVHYSAPVMHFSAPRISVPTYSMPHYSAPAYSGPHYDGGNGGRGGRR